MHIIKGKLVKIKLKTKFIFMRKSRKIVNKFKLN